MPLDERDLAHLTRCVDLAEEAVDAGDEPFGSLLVSASGEVLFEDRNRVGGGDGTRHPELALAQWAGAHVPTEERATTTAYTSGEHCPMCSAAHGWAGLGRIVVATTTAQLLAWQRELGAPPSAVVPLPVSAVLPGAVVDGPAPQLADRVRELHARSLRPGSSQP
ncbi:nucleoside deaminase [Quadrisphaera oryzae]|uniref:nucleoside deaminase n=1 Tax=Quadrisphaera TaxID=317661 RepID=UPI0016474529|nr:nucleoside deaminase [Quadrisphaera sp. RL12-1S]